jgi:hypothetical protein
MKLLLLIPALLLLSSCAQFKDKQVITQTKIMQRNIPLQVAPKPIEFPDTEWFVVSEENFDSVMKKIEDHGGSLTFMAITPKGYENLAIGVGDLRRYILQQKQIIAYYEKAIQGPPEK